MKPKHNYTKKIAWLRYQDLAYKLQKEGKSYSDITRQINYRLARTKLKIKLSKTFIYEHLTKLNKEKNGSNI